MLEAKDPAIKLFGKTIPVTDIPASPGDSPRPGDGSSGPVVADAMDQDHASSTNSSLEENTNRDGEGREVDEDASGEKSIETNQKHGTEPMASEELSNPNSGSGISENPKTLSVEIENGTLKTTKSEEEQSETSNPQEKTLKKPDKILPCPRCKSMDTKFCYYNNYNVNQPRHFCKNCQRYWTAGGTMRNVPVGAGRRKNKSSASHYRHITVPEALQSAQTDLGLNPSLKSNGTVLNFGKDTPLCESMASVLNLSEKTMRHYTGNGFHKPEDLRIPVSYGGGESGNAHSNRSSITATNSMDEACNTRSQEQAVQNCQGFPPHMQCYPGAPWPYPWPSAQCSPPVPLPTFCPPNYPMPFYPTAAYWGCSVPSVWNVPWLPLTSSANQPAPSSGPKSPTLGKHSRDENTHKPNISGEGELPKESNPERCLWVPKTLRIDDPGEAAKSSIWATLGIKKDKTDSIGGRGLFKAFQTKGDEKNHVSGTSSVLEANPAALSRSVNFQESS